MTQTSWLIIGGVFLVLSILANMILLAALAQSGDDARNDNPNGNCAAEWGQETAIHGSAE